jgi:hypothetical protein
VLCREISNFKPPYVQLYLCNLFRQRINSHLFHTRAAIEPYILLAHISTFKENRYSSELLAAFNTTT